MTFNIPSRRREESKFFVWFWWWCQPSALRQPWQFCINLEVICLSLVKATGTTAKMFFVTLRRNMLTLLGRRRCGDVKAFFEERRSTGHNTLRRKTDVDERTNTWASRNTLISVVNERGQRTTHSQKVISGVFIVTRSILEISVKTNKHRGDVYKKKRKNPQCKFVRKETFKGEAQAWVFDATDRDRLETFTTEQKDWENFFCYIPDRWGLFCLCA